MWWWGPEWGWLGVLIAVAFWAGIIALAVVLIKGEVPRLEGRFGGSPALRLLEERYARGEISREEFLERRAVLLRPSPPAATSASGSDADPTQPLAPPPEPPSA